jgi:hypothetical protein
MKKELQLCSFEQAKALKELGFDWDSEYYYDLLLNNKLCYGSKLNRNVEKLNCFSAPTVALTLKWFRDRYNLISHIQIGNSPAGFFYIQIWNEKGEYLFDTYEIAESELLDELIELLKNQNK